jgi:hypothetical protein
MKELLNRQQPLALSDTDHVLWRLRLARAPSYVFFFPSKKLPIAAEWLKMSLKHL